VRNLYGVSRGPADPSSSPALIARRSFLRSLVAAGAMAPLGPPLNARGMDAADPTAAKSQHDHSPDSSDQAAINATRDPITAEKIRRARLSGPSAVTANATVAEMDSEGKMTVLYKGSNEWVCCPGNENVIGDVPMSLDPMGMQWFMDLHAHKPKPTNTAPGIIYMLCGAIQHSYIDPFDRTSPPIPIGPHWMVLWPFSAKAAGLSTVMRDAGTMVMFAGTPYAHLHICGSPWDGNEYHPGDRVIKALRYSRP
jgi:hypothetical protein